MRNSEKELSVRITDKTATVLYGGKLKLLSGVRRDSLISLLKVPTESRDSDWYMDLENLLDKSMYASRQVGRKLRLEGGKLIDEQTGYEFTESLVKRVSQHKEMGLDTNRALKFAERLAANPSLSTRETLPGFVEDMDITLNEDGTFTAYKAVTCDFKDKWTGKVDNRPGAEPEPIPRSMVDDDKNKPCSVGYHVGSYDYANNYATSNDKLVAVRVAPENVVCVPHDISVGKIRTTHYKVLFEIAPGQHLEPLD